MRNRFTYSLYFLLAGLVALTMFTSCKSKQQTSQKPNSNQQQTAYDKRKFDYLYFEGINAKIRGNFNEAIEKFQKCIQINPNEPAVYYELATILYNAAKYNEALSFAKKAAELDPNNEWYLLLKANVCRATGKYQDAIDGYKNLIKRSPGNIDYHFDLAALYLYAVKPESAIEVYDNIDEKFGMMPDVLVQKCRIYVKMNKPEMADKELGKLLTKFPNELQYASQVAQFYSEQGLKERAFNTYKKIVELDPDNGEALLNLSDYYRNQRNATMAFDHLKKAFQSKSLGIDTKMKVLINYYNYSDLDSAYRKTADTLCSLLLLTHPDDAKSHAIHGDFLYRDKKYKEAGIAFRKAATLDNSKYPIWNQLLIIDNLLNDFDQQEKDASATIELFPNEPLPYLFKGMSLITQHKYNDAVKSLKEGKEYAIDNPKLKGEFYSSLGEAFHHLKNYPESDQAFSSSLELDPQNVSVLNNYAYFLSIRGELLEKAEQLAKKANELTPNVASYQDTYAWVLYKMGKFDEAKKWLELALTNGGNKNATILEHLGDVWFKIGDKDKALIFWNQAKQVGKGSEFLEKKIQEKKLLE